MHANQDIFVPEKLLRKGLKLGEVDFVHCLWISAYV